MTSPIFVINKATLVTDAQVATMCAAVGRQLTLDVAPAYGRIAVPVMFTKQAPAGATTILVVDTTDDPQALGYHEETNGVPDGVIGCKPELDAGAKVLTGPYSVASVLSHEVLELFLDPTTAMWADSGRRFMVAYEIADPVQNDVYMISLVGAAGTAAVSVSNFVLPNWFDPESPAGVKTDHLGLLTTPFTLRKGGYWVQMAEGKVTNRFGDDVPDWVRATKAAPTSRASRFAAGPAASAA